MNNSRLKLMSLQEKLETLQFRKLWVLDSFNDRRQEKAIMLDLSELPGYDKYLIAKKKVDADRKISAPELRFMYEQPLLPRDTEYHLLRKYNFIKYRFKKLATSITVNYKDHIIDKAVVNLNKYYTLMGEIKSLLAGANARSVMTIAKSMNYITLEMAITDGYAGLVQAVDYFDYRKKGRKTRKPIKFITYAWYVIKDRIRKGINEERETAGFAMTNFDPEDFENGLENLTAVEDKSVEDRELVIVVRKMLHCLKERERQILIDRHGNDLTLEAIGKKLNITKERVRQLDIRGIDIMRREHGSNEFCTKESTI